MNKGGPLFKLTENEKVEVKDQMMKKRIERKQRRMSYLNTCYEKLNQDIAQMYIIYLYNRNQGLNLNNQVQDNDID